MSEEGEPDLRVELAARAWQQCERVAALLGFGAFFEDAKAARAAVEKATERAVRCCESPAEESSRIVLQREFLKVLAEVRGARIREILALAPAEEKAFVFSRVADFLEPELDHPTLGTPPGAFFDPECWVFATNSELDLKLAAFVAGMLYQEEGIERAGRRVMTVAMAIASKRAMRI
ncbi:MAG: hypothetical protein ACKVXR_11585 [Planctomycetota bacterium]